MPRVDVYLADPAGLLEAASFDAGATIDIERSDDGGATFSAVDSIAIAPNATQPFQLWDVDGAGESLYRWRISSADDARHSEYSAAFLGVLATATVPTRAYVQLADVFELFKTKPLPALYPRLSNLIQVATDECIRAMDGRDFYRHPASGSGTWLVEGSGDGLLHAHDGIVSLDQVEVTLDDGLTYTDVPSADWVLEGATPGEPVNSDQGQPGFHLRLVYPFSITSTFPRRNGGVRLTGVRGWGLPPAQLREGVKGRVRQLAAGDGTFSGAIAGPPEYTAGNGFEYWPQVLYRFLEDEAARFMGCWM